MCEVFVPFLSGAKSAPLSLCYDQYSVELAMHLSIQLTMASFHYSNQTVSLC